MRHGLNIRRVPNFLASVGLAARPHAAWVFRLQEPMAGGARVLQRSCFQCTLRCSAERVSCAGSGRQLNRHSTSRSVTSRGVASRDRRVTSRQPTVSCSTGQRCGAWHRWRFICRCALQQTSACRTFGSSAWSSSKAPAGSPWSSAQQTPTACTHTQDSTQTIALVRDSVSIRQYIINARGWTIMARNMCS